MPERTRNRTKLQGEVTHYPYRTARVANVLITGPDSHYADLWQELADTAGVKASNHEVYAITNDGGTLYIEFSDCKTYIGTKLIEGRW